MSFLLSCASCVLGCASSIYLWVCGFVWLIILVPAWSFEVFIYVFARFCELLCLYIIVSAWLIQ